ncbi:hypothetical protein L3X07_11960 [Levilactobacillus brevis]|nr:hypothetical protein [Levilactobacillus brevis]
MSSVSSGVGTANTYLKGLQKSAAAETFYIPKKSINSGSFKQSMDTYMSPNHKLTKLTVVLKDDPSSAAPWRGYLSWKRLSMEACKEPA